MGARAVELARPDPAVVIQEQQEPYSARFDLASLSFPPSLVKGTQFQNFPTIGITGFETLVGNVGWKQQPGYNYSLQSNLSTQRGKQRGKQRG